MANKLLLKGSLLAISMFFLAATITLPSIEWTLFMDIDFSQLGDGELILYQWAFFIMFSVSFLGAAVME